MSVHKRGSAWEVRWREGDRQRSRSFDLKADAQAWDRDVARRRQLGAIAVQQLTAKSPTLNRWITTRWAPEHGSRLEAKTRDRYANSYEVHIEPWLGHLHLHDLTVGRLREWQADRLKHGASPHALAKARTFLSSVLRHAAESEAIPHNPLLLVRAPKTPHADQVTPIVPVYVEQIRALLRPRDATMVSVLAYSGLRPGEMRALRWGDIGNTILVQNGSNPNGSLKATKTRRGLRNVRLLPALAADLAAWREQTGGTGQARVFPSTGVDGGMTDAGWNDWRGKVWTPARRQVLDVNAVPYDLRHSFASLLLADGRTVHYVAEQLGHDAALTISRYGHIYAEYRDSRDLDIDQEIANARAAVTASPPTPPSVAAGLGTRQRDLLAVLAAGETALATWNHRRAAEGLIARGLAEHTRGRGARSRYQLTDRGQAAAKETNA